MVIFSSCHPHLRSVFFEFFGAYVIKNEEYEKAYSNAREVLYNRGKKISRPVCGAGGVRHCPVDGFLLTDRELLKEAWGESLADEILVETSPDIVVMMLLQQPLSSPSIDCSERHT